LKSETMTSVKKKRPYRKSTPIGRLRRNADKVTQHAALLTVRLASWGSSDERVAAAEKLASTILVRAGEVDGLLADLESSGFAPPEKQRAVTWEAGQRVAVARKFRAKYEAAYQGVMRLDPSFLDFLVVDKVLASGEVVVRRGGRTPFLVPKTHLVEAGEDPGA
jgi:hypothetical protein